MMTEAAENASVVFLVRFQACHCVVLLIVGLVMLNDGTVPLMPGCVIFVGSVKLPSGMPVLLPGSVKLPPGT